MRALIVAIIALSVSACSATMQPRGLGAQIALTGTFATR